jgi:hypothetical protein
MTTSPSPISPVTGENAGPSRQASTGLDTMMGTTTRGPADDIMASLAELDMSGNNVQDEPLLLGGSEQLEGASDKATLGGVDPWRLAPLTVGPNVEKVGDRAMSPLTFGLVAETAVDIHGIALIAVVRAPNIHDRRGPIRRRDDPNWGQSGVSRSSRTTRHLHRQQSVLGTNEPQDCSGSQRPLFADCAISRCAHHGDQELGPSSGIGPC